MQEPSSVVPPLAEDPITGVRVAAGDEVVACDIAAVPPAALDALGAVYQLQRTVEELPPVARLQGDRLRQQPQRTGKRRCGAARLARCARAPRRFRPMVIVALKTLHRLVAEARAQALDAPRPVIRLGGVLAVQRERARLQGMQLVYPQLDGLARVVGRDAREVLAQ